MSHKIFRRSIFIGFLFCAQLSYSQTKELRLDGSAFLHMALYDDFLLGYGGSLKLLWPLRKNDNFITSAIEFDRLTERNRYTGRNITYTFSMASIGYRKTIKSFYFEPQAGFGLYNETGYSSTCFFAGFEPGIQKRKFSFALSYHFTSADGFVFGEQFHIFAIKVGYNILGIKKE
ncbi:MAG: hypothetical protein ACO25B_07345 [Chitinophagaceae bacterium]